MYAGMRVRGHRAGFYIEAMREGVRRHGPVRAGLYSMLRDRRA